jgi:hypothetical protein
MWEFCEDWWDPDYYKSSPRKDPAGPTTGVARVVMGEHEIAKAMIEDVRKAVPREEKSGQESARSLPSQAPAA